MLPDWLDVSLTNAAPYECDDLISTSIRIGVYFSTSKSDYLKTHILHNSVSGAIVSRLLLCSFVEIVPVAFNDKSVGELWLRPL